MKVPLIGPYSMWLAPKYNLNSGKMEMVERPSPLQKHSASEAAKVTISQQAKDLYKSMIQSKEGK